MNDTNVIPPRPFSSWIDWAIFSVALLVGAGFAWYVHSIGLTLAYVDQFSHWSIARQISDSVTPGVSQIGFWQPLLHLLLAPVAAISMWYVDGSAAAIVMVPMYALGAVMLYRICEALSGSRWLSLAGVLAYGGNPYVLYFATTAMSEVLFLTLFLVVAWAFIRWWYTLSVMDAVILGAAITFACLARFEGLLLLPSVAVLMGIRMLRRGFPIVRIEAMLVMFMFIASIGLVSIFLYGWIYGDDPLAFMRSRWAAAAQQESLLLPAKGHVTVAIKQMVISADHMVGSPIVLVGAVSLLGALALRRRERLLVFSVASILIMPTFFVLLALYQGSAVIYVPEVSPYFDRFFNTRYALSLIGIAVVGVVVAAAALIEIGNKRAWTAPLGVLGATVLMGVLLNSTALMAYKEACPGTECFSQIRTEFQAADPQSVTAARELGNKWDGGRILMTRALHAEMSVKTGIPQSSFVLESNHPYYFQALSAPWMFTRYMVMANPDGFATNDWYLENELVTGKWNGTAALSAYYTLVLDTPRVRVWKINDVAVAEMAAKYGLSPEEVPSLRADSRWDTINDYERIGKALSIPNWEALAVSP